MLRAILFDLDDTLLGNDTESFMRRYFALLPAAQTLGLEGVESALRGAA